MTDDEAEKLLKALQEHYREPVLPLSEFCRAMKTWVSCIWTLNEEQRADDRRTPQGVLYYSVLNRILIDIKKSNLLSRLLYAREPLRTRKCPTHEGRWHGPTKRVCEHGCGGTGWLPEA